MSLFNDVFDVFDIGFPERKYLGAVSKESLEKLTGKIPDELLGLFGEEGLFSFGNGLFFLEDPTKTRSVLKDWNIDPDENSLFLRTAFGDFFYWDGSSVQVMHVHSGVQNTLSPDIVRFLNFGIHSEKYNQQTLFGRFLKKAIINLGELEMEECYAFVPALALGGKEDVKNLQKVKWLEYTGVLAQSLN